METRLRLWMPALAATAAAAFGTYWYTAAYRTPLLLPAAFSTAEPVPEGAPELVSEALKHRGTRYVWGGSSPRGFDCSGFVMYLCQKQLGVDLPRRASQQAAYGEPVENADLAPGDLLFFSTYRRGICHVGVYLGGDRFIHAANRRMGVRVDRLVGYYGRRLKAARRLATDPAQVTASAAPKETAG